MAGAPSSQVNLSQPPSNPPTLILCDWAEAIGGKLYIMGAGWSRIIANTQASIAVAVLWMIPWSQANRRHHIELTLVTEDGQPFLDSEGEKLRVEGDIEVGRPPGLKEGSSLEAPIALKLPNVAFPPGGYRFDFHVNGSLEATASFDAIGGGQL